MEEVRTYWFFKKRKEPTSCDASSWITLVAIGLLHLLAFEWNERRVCGLLHVAEIADDHHGRLLRTEHRIVGGLHTLDAPLTAFRPATRIRLGLHRYQHSSSRDSRRVAVAPCCRSRRARELGSRRAACRV